VEKYLDRIEDILQQLAEANTDFKTALAHKRARVESLERGASVVDSCTTAAQAQMPSMRRDCDALKDV
jgi:cell division septum initiation protein DivIVA